MMSRVKERHVVSLPILLLLCDLLLLLELLHPLDPGLVAPLEQRGRVDVRVGVVLVVGDLQNLGQAQSRLSIVHAALTSMSFHLL